MADASSIPPNASKGKAESSLSVTDARYLAQIRGAMARIGRRSGSDSTGVAAALADLADAATIDVEVPTGSNRRAGRAAKQGIKQLTRWYLRYVAQQTTVLGQASVRLGTALGEQADRQEDTMNGLANEVARLGERIERLERRLGETDDPPAAATELPSPEPERRV